MTVFVFVTCFVGAAGGLLFGYDLGVSGGVTSMNEFLEKFFPSVFEKMNDGTTKEDQYCKFNSQLLTCFTSSLYLVALVASFVASAVTRTAGRKISMLIGGSVYLAGSIVNCFADNIVVLIIGRTLVGIGVGFANQSVPVYLSEMAPAKLRGAFNMGFQMALTIGILVAQLVNYVTAQMKSDGWRWSLGIAAVPAVIMTIGSVVLPDTPNSLLERGHAEKAKAVLAKLRGTTDVDEEFIDLMEASEDSEMVDHPWSDIIQRRYRPHLVMAIMIPLFQQLTGINVIMFYAPVVFKTLGFGDDASLMFAVIFGLVNLLASLVSIFSIDKFGRRFLFIEGGFQMYICHILVGAVIGLKFGNNGEGTLSKDYANLVLILICIYVTAYAWSWGPLGLMVPEIFPLEVRSAGQALNVGVNMFFSFVIAQTFLLMLCHMKYGLFFFFAACEIVMTFFIYLFLPETKNVPIEEMNRVWKQHWFWGKYITDEVVIGNFELSAEKIAPE